MIILGIDPGLAATGFGLVKKGEGQQKNALKYLNHGIIETSPELASEERLKSIHQQLNKIIREHKPQVMAIENVYFFKNTKTALPVSQAKGVIMLTAAKKKMPVVELTPLQVKMAIAGYGRAEKKQVQKMVQTILNLDSPPRPSHAADALSVAICFAHSIKN